MKIKIDTEFDIEQIIYLVTDTEQLPRVVVGISIIPGDQVMYTVNCADTSSDHYGFEMSDKKDLVGSL